jgi:ferric-dicitrate binding protein FerR (iron transport regulator)
MSARFEILLERFQGDDATPDELAELETLLRANPDKRRILVERLLLEVQLHKAFRGIAPVKQAPVAPMRMGWFVPVGAAAAVLLFALSGWLIFYPYLGRRDGPASVIESGQVRAGNATVSRVAANVPFVVEGTVAAVVRLPDGSRAELDPATEAIVHTQAGDARPVVELTQGGGKFSVPPGQGRFRVETPLGTVVVLGTEFTVRIGAQKDAAGNEAPSLAVSVLSGKVQVQTGGDDHVLIAGSSRVFPEPEEKFVANPIPRIDGTKNDKRPERIIGLLRTVASAKNSITVLTTDDDEIVDLTLRLAPNVAVVLNAKPAGVDDLKVGRQVRIKLSADRLTVVEIQQEVRIQDAPGLNIAGPNQLGPDEIDGVLKVVDAVKKSIVVRTAQAGKFVDRTIGLTDDLEVLLNGDEGSLFDLKPGMQVHLKLSEDRKFVVELVGVRKRSDDDHKKNAGEEIKGLLQAVDLGKNTITIKGKDANLTFAVMNNVPIAWKGQAIRLADLIPGMQVRVRLSEDRHTVIDIRVDGKKVKSK